MVDPPRPLPSPRPLSAGPLLSPGCSRCPAAIGSANSGRVWMAEP